MPEDMKIYETSVGFEEFQPLICSKADLCYGTTIHFDMNGVEDMPGTEGDLPSATLWINADYWRVCHGGQLKFDSDTIDRDKMRAFDNLISGKRFIELQDRRDSQELRLLFDDIEIVIEKPDDEVYDLVDFYLPNGKIYYYSDALYESHEIDDERRLLWEVAILALLIYDKNRTQFLYEQRQPTNYYPNIPFDYYDRDQKLNPIYSQKERRREAYA